MLVFQCFPAIARRGFAKLVKANLAKPMRFCTPIFSQTPAFVGRNVIGGGVEAQAFATRKRVCALVAKGAKFPRKRALPRLDPEFTFQIIEQFLALIGHATDCSLGQQHHRQARF